MARHDREERQHRRWLEDARKHLGRGDLESTLPALLRLPPPLREELLPRVAALFRGAVQEQHRRATWGMLSTLAARADAEPGLVECGAEAEQARATYWPLMWAAGRAREWARAQRLWKPLAAAARARAPRLEVALDAWVAAEGAPAPEALAPALACLPPLDPRLGIEPARTRAALLPPRSVAEVEEAVLALCALEPFPVFASRIEAWAREAPAEVARAMWELAGQLAARELWLRAAAGEKLASLSEPASLLARAAHEEGAAQALSAPMLQALRVVASRLPPAGVSSAQAAEAFSALAQAAALLPEARPWVVQAISGIRFSGAALPRALRLHEALLALAPDAALWARAFLAWCEHSPEARSAPGWLQEGMRRLVATEAPALRAWLRGAAPSERTELIEYVASTCESDLVEAWVDACWEGADEELRRGLSDAVRILLDRSRARRVEHRLERMLHGPRELDAATRVLLEVESMLEQAHALMRLPPEGLRIWRRFASRVLPYRLEFLEEALRQASSDAEAWEAAERYLEARQGDSAYVEALRTMSMFGREALARRVRERWLERRANDVQALAEAAVAAAGMGIARKHLHPLLQAFLLALAGQPSSVPSAAVRRALALAREHGVRPRKRGATRKKSAGAPAPSRRRKARTKAPAGEQSRHEEGPRTAPSPEDGKGSP